MKPFASPGIGKRMFLPVQNSEKSVIHLSHDWQVQQTNGEGLNVLDSRVIAHLESNLVLRKIKSSFSAMNGTKTDRSLVSCKKWCVHTVMSAIQASYFGDCLSAIEPHLVETLLEFDSFSWRTFNQFPSFLTREMDDKRGKIVRTLQEYFKRPQQQRCGEVWFMRALETPIPSSWL